MTTIPILGLEGDRDDNVVNDGVYMVMLLIPMLGTLVMIIISMEMIIMAKMGDDNDNNGDVIDTDAGDTGDDNHINGNDNQGKDG